MRKAVAVAKALANRTTKRKAVVVKPKPVHYVDGRRLVGAGDINRSYSADRIADEKPVRQPFLYDGELWVSTGIHGSRKIEEMEAVAVRIVPPEQFKGKTFTYRECTNKPGRFYHGIRIQVKGETWVMTGPAHSFKAAPAGVFAMPEQDWPVIAGVR